MLHTQIEQDVSESSGQPWWVSYQAINFRVKEAGLPSNVLPIPFKAMVIVEPELLEFAQISCMTPWFSYPALGPSPIMTDR